MLTFGYNDGLPPGTETAWGARVIIDQQGNVDLLHDRQDAIGSAAAVSALLDKLNGGVNDSWIAQARELLQGYEMRTREAKEFTLYADDDVTVVGNTNASAGYLYVAAYPTPS